MNPYKILRFSNTIFAMMGIMFSLCGSLGIALGKLDMAPASTDLLIDMICIGVVAMLVTFLAASGMRGNSTHLKIYVAFVTLILFAQAAVGFYAIKRQEEMQSYMRNKWESSTNQIKSDIQLRLSCCGFYNNTDLPFKEGGDGKCVPGNNNPGCYTKLKDTQINYSTAFMSVCFSLLLVEILCIGGAILILKTGQPEEYFTGKEPRDL
eukprot:NODE_95_length_21511_cov_0.501168.p10 type:complete len:208 gc:universal NODE_95_length_21511_cov_0.501168:13136-13759(+)